ncbi:MAG: hypothetical protein GXP22_07145 [Gammaproteobacteria bacterium]|nr:hypothetical protein [Gammaproteobacteria bacterium]
MLMLLGFISQAIAAAVIPAPMMEAPATVQNDSTYVGMSMMNHTSHGMVDMTTATADCCKQECHCPMNGCVSAMLPNVIHSNDVVTVSFQIVSPARSLTISQFPISLYRPPITA